MNTENPNMLWASLVVEECVRGGADTFFLAPGSRCTPLVMAIARHPDARIHQHFDERALAFAAQGWARANRRPGVVVTTSGTAVSNLHPAAVEARQDRVPLLFLTADRPPELRDTGANQSIDQIMHFGRETVWFFDLPAPTVAIPPQFVLTTVAQAVYRAMRGPVQLNCQFREPLAPTPVQFDAEAYLTPVATWMRATEPYTAYSHMEERLTPLDEEGLTDLVRPNERVLVICGAGLEEADAYSVHQLCMAKNWPVVADITSGLKFGKFSECVIRHVDLILADTPFMADAAPDVVLVFGHRFVSKRLLDFLEHFPMRALIMVNPSPERLDPVHKVTHRFVSDVDGFCTSLGRSDLHRAEDAWLRLWADREREARAHCASLLDNGATLSEPAAVRALSAQLPDLHGLYLGASMPVRDMDMFVAENPHRVHVAANRGASGIDGTIASAFGFAQGLGQPVTAIIGDLTALHDLNSLALLSRHVPVILVVLNNHGGGIFHFLPISGHDPEFERFFGTPHGWHFEHAARQFGLAYARPRDLEALRDVHRKAVGSRKSWVIEVETERKRNQLLHEAIFESLELPEET